MSPNAQSMFSDLSGWQRLLDRHQDLFCEIIPGSSIGIVPKSTTGLMPGKRAAALRASGFESPDGAVLAWEAREHGMHAAYRRCRGLDEAGVDLLLVADDEALEQIRDHLESEPLAGMKKLIRRGNILFYVMRTKHELQDAGYEDFLESLGLAYLGACR